MLVSVGTQTVDVGLRPLRLLSKLPERPAARLHGRRRSAAELREEDDELDELVEEDFEDVEPLGRPRQRLPPPKRRREELAYGLADDFGDVWDHEDDVDIDDEYDDGFYRTDVRWRQFPTGRASRPGEALQSRRTVMRATTLPPQPRAVAVSSPHQPPPRGPYASLVDASPTEVEEEYFDEEGEEEELQEYTDEEIEEEDEADSMPLERPGAKVLELPPERAKAPRGPGHLDPRGSGLRR